MKCTKCLRNKQKSEFYSCLPTQCKECVKTKTIARRNKMVLNPEWREIERLRIKKWKDDNHEHVKEVSRIWWRSIREEVLVAYGGKRPICRCCKESTKEFLAIDHKNGGGSKHLKELKLRGSGFYRWLKQNGFPKKDFQILCHNCNFAKGRYGQCPHSIK